MRALRGPPKEPDDASTGDTDVEPEATLASSPRRPIVCSACGHRVTWRSERIRVRGEHEHVCVNPHGIAFHIGCYASAPGCVPYGRAESYWSWFPGYRWQIVLCAACGRHLGWGFSADDKASFHGLVVQRIVEGREGDEAPDA